MTLRTWISYGLVLSLMTACAPATFRPTVETLPGKDKTLEQYETAEAYCRERASHTIQTSPESQQALNAAKSAAVTGAVGAGVGAIIGAVTGNVKGGAAIGGAGGLALGAAGGSGAGQAHARSLQQSYDASYRACMYGAGMQVQGRPGGFMSRDQERRYR